MDEYISKKFDTSTLSDYINTHCQDAIQLLLKLIYDLLTTLDNIQLKQMNAYTDILSSLIYYGALILKTNDFNDEIDYADNFNDENKEYIDNKYINNIFIIICNNYDEHSFSCNINKYSKKIFFKRLQQKLEYYMDIDNKFKELLISNGMIYGYYQIKNDILDDIDLFDTILKDI